MEAVKLMDCKNYVTTEQNKHPTPVRAAGRGGLAAAKAGKTSGRRWDGSGPSGGVRKEKREGERGR